MLTRLVAGRIPVLTIEDWHSRARCGLMAALVRFLGAPSAADASHSRPRRGAWRGGAAGRAVPCLSRLAAGRLHRRGRVLRAERLSDHGRPAARAGGDPPGGRRRGLLAARAAAPAPAPP